MLLSRKKNIEFLASVFFLPPFFDDPPRIPDLFYDSFSIAGRTTRSMSFENVSIEFQVCVAFVMIIRLNSFPTPLNLDTCVHDTLYIFIFMISLFFISTRTSLIDILLQLNDKLISLRVLFDIRNKISRYEVVRSIGSRFFVFEKNSRMKSVMRCYPFLVSFFLLQIFLFSFSLLLFFFFWRFIYLHTIFFLFLPTLLLFR